MLGMVIYTAFGVKKRWGEGCHKFGPIILVSISAVLIMMDPVRHVFQDWGIWADPSSYEYRDDCGSETAKCLSVTGVFFTIIATYVGFALLIVGTMWNANLCRKCVQIRNKWRELRGQAAA